MYSKAGLQGGRRRATLTQVSWDARLSTPTSPEKRACILGEPPVTAHRGNPGVKPHATQPVYLLELLLVILIIPALNAVRPIHRTLLLDINNTTQCATLALPTRITPSAML